MDEGGRGALRRAVRAKTPTQLWGAVEEKSGERVRIDREPALALLGRVLDDRFEVTDVLGRGGMGVVFAARDRALERDVVVKVLAPGRIDPTAGPRLMREAKLASRVEHPSIVTVFHLGMLETGEPYVVMERLHGRDFAGVLAEKRRLGLEETVAVLEPIADALEALHAAGVVHRDLKPSNLFVLDGQGGRVKLIDFGLAMLDAESHARLTRAGHLIGTPEYMAPELARADRPGPACDVYSLASIAYELLSGEPPFVGTPMDVLVAKAKERPQHLRTWVDEPWAGRAGDALARALDRDPTRRPTPRALVRMLREAIHEEAPQPIVQAAPPVPAPAPSAPETPWLPWAIAVASTVATVLALVALLAQ